MTGWRSVSLAVALSIAATAAFSHEVHAQEERLPFIRILGVAQDGGFPHAACEHRACRQARDGEIPSHLVSSLALVLPASGKVYLFDATPDLRRQLDLLRDVRDLPTDRVDRAPLDGVFLTHAHMGHYTGLAFLGFEAVSASALPVWGTERMGRFLSEHGPWSQLVDFGNIELRRIDERTPVELGEGVTVRAFTVPHRDEFSDTVAFVIEGPRRKVLFVPDTDRWESWRPGLVERLGDIDVALLDSTFYSMDELPGRNLEEAPHPLTTTSMDLLQGLVDDGRVEVRFLHLNHSNPALLEDSIERREVESRGFAVASEGDEIGL